MKHSGKFKPLHPINYFQIFVILLAFTLGILCYAEGKYISVLVELSVIVFMTICYFNKNLEENSK